MKEGNPDKQGDDVEEVWIEAQMLRCITSMGDSISATHLQKLRPGFGQVIVPAKGSVLASPVDADWNPEPDYFFDWHRDSALVMDTVTRLAETSATPRQRQHWAQHFQNYVDFNLRASYMDGAAAASQIQGCIQPAFRRYARPQAELMQLSGDAVLSDTRFNPDGTADIQNWSRPQYDGPALRALACLRHADFLRAQGEALSPSLLALMQQDLDFTARHADHPCIGLWEEEFDQHYYTSIVQLGALIRGAAWATTMSDVTRANDYRNAAAATSKGLDRHWDDQLGFYKASRNMAINDQEQCLDMAVILGVLHARLPEGRHSIHDDRVLATLNRLEAMFERHFPVNRCRPDGHGLALGRYKADQYQGGNPWYNTTLAAAEFYYRCNDVERGDAVMRMVRYAVPSDGSLSEQFDKASGQPCSARHLAWSYAAFITAAHARRQATTNAFAPKKVLNHG